MFLAVQPINLYFSLLIYITHKQLPQIMQSDMQSHQTLISIRYVQVHDTILTWFPVVVKAYRTKETIQINLNTKSTGTMSKLCK